VYITGKRNRKVKISFSRARVKGCPVYLRRNCIYGCGKYKDTAIRNVLLQGIVVQHVLQCGFATQAHLVIWAFENVRLFGRLGMRIGFWKLVFPLGMDF
jgi:hypothetical protein